MAGNSFHVEPVRRNATETRPTTKACISQALVVESETVRRRIAAGGYLAVKASFCPAA